MTRTRIVLGGGDVLADDRLAPSGARLDDRGQVEEVIRARDRPPRIGLTHWASFVGP